MLKCACDAIAAALLDGVPVHQDNSIRLLCEKFLEDDGDQSDEAAARAKSLRCEFATALRKTLIERGIEAYKRSDQGEHVEENCFPPVRIEVRETAGRYLLGGSFSVGSASECDVQLYGDENILAVHCIAVAMPGGLILIDTSSGSKTVMSHRSSMRPLSQPTCGVSVVSGDERVTYSLSAHTTITVGPRNRDASRPDRMWNGVGLRSLFRPKSVGHVSLREGVVQYPLAPYMDGALDSICRSQGLEEIFRCKSLDISHLPPKARVRKGTHLSQVSTTFNSSTCLSSRSRSRSRSRSSECWCSPCYD